MTSLLGAIGLPVCIPTARPMVATARWMTIADIPDTVEGLLEELTAPRWLPVSALDIAEVLPPPVVDPDDVRNMWPASPDWHQLAKCATADPISSDAMFFGVDNAAALSLPPEMVEQARAICNGCGARPSCLLWAIEHDERYGIWAGTTGRQRTNMRAALREGRVTVDKLLQACG